MVAHIPETTHLICISGLNPEYALTLNPLEIQDNDVDSTNVATSLFDGVEHEIEQYEDLF